MSEHFFDFLKEGRFDRFDTLYELEQDRAPDKLTVLGETARALAIAEECDPKYNSRCMGATPNGGKRLYSFETWGVMAHVMARYADDAEWAHLQRLDFRIECDIDPRKLPGLYEYLREHKARGRNVSSFDSRAREKKEGRHAGGHGVTVGSHKSDIRLVLYKRPGERGAIELQLSGKKLRDMVGKALERKRAGGDVLTVFHLVSDLCQAALEKMARECGFESSLAMVRSIGPTAPLNPPEDFVAEAPVQMAVQSFFSLSEAEQDRALVEMMRDRLNLPRA